jgi:hypothetical protein
VSIPPPGKYFTSLVRSAAQWGAPDAGEPLREMDPPAADPCPVGSFDADPASCDGVKLVAALEPRSVGSLVTDPAVFSTVPVTCPVASFAVPVTCPVASFAVPVTCPVASFAVPVTAFTGSLMAPVGSSIAEAICGVSTTAIATTATLPNRRSR